MRTISTAAALLLLAMGVFGSGLTVASGPAAAQRSGITPFPLNRRQNIQRTNRGVLISVSYRFFIEGRPGPIGEQAKLSEDGRRAVYRLLAKECEALLDTIAASCEITRANVSSQMNTSTSRYRSSGVNISGSATYRISLKPLGGQARREGNDNPQAGSNQQ